MPPPRRKPPRTANRPAEPKADGIHSPPTHLDDQAERIALAHGGGGELMGRLIREHILTQLTSPVLARLTDGALLECGSGRIVLTTDSYVVQPIEFPGGDIGRLAVCGTVNDLAVMGARPLALSLGLIIEEGFSLQRLDRILASIAAACEEAGVQVVTGDTKVIDKRGDDGLIINTAGVGAMTLSAPLGLDRIRAGDVIIVNGTLGDHGMAVLSKRNGLEFETDLVSDTAPLNHLISDVLQVCPDVRFMRDATRGGAAGVLADIVEGAGLSVMVEESKIPVHSTVRMAAEMLGFDLLNVANEGKAVVVAPHGAAGAIVSAMRRHPCGQHAAVIGTVVASLPLLAELATATGGRRIIQRPYGEDLPRIC